jgi:hypothetical protein
VNELSEAALRYGAALGLNDAAALTVRLYGYHRWPLSPKLVMSLPGQHELRQCVLKEGPAELTRHWRSQRHETRGGWLSWVRRDELARFPAIAHKLYVSPDPTSVRDALRELVPELTLSRCVRFKVGATPAFLARPDKLVAYFSDREAALEVAEALKSRIDGLAAHGVPFSCPVDPAGVLSWGVDPPHVPGELRSWRTWLCAEIAEAMTSCGPGDRLAAARRRLAMLGIDPDSWEPRPELWRDDGPG